MATRSPAQIITPRTVSSNRDEDDFRLRPRKPRIIHETATAAACIYAMRAASRMSGRTTITHLLPQRCIVKLRYHRNQKNWNLTGGRKAQQWSRLGRYLQRKTAVANPEQPAFDNKVPRSDAPRKLREWELAEDKRIFHLIISPQSSAVDHEKLTRDFMARVEQDMGRKLEWIAAAHVVEDEAHKKKGKPFYPHIHIALRGVDRAGNHFRFKPEYVQERFREIAADICTQQLGPRRVRSLGRVYGLREHQPSISRQI